MSSAARNHAHASLPAPVVHAGFTTQSKSNVLAGVQDAYWSDDEADDAECPLCLEEMDISDLNFKPCICGYQVCRFCWHHIKENLNGRCPACRREYTDEAVQFKAIGNEDHKRLTQLKKQRERERKELEANGRRHLANVRVVQRNVVYVVGIGPRFAKEELIPTLRSNEYFGQYGKISKILLVKRTPSGGGEPVVGLYITFHRREDASRCIAAVDGSSAPGGSREVMRASHGTTKYCMAFLRSAACSDHACMNLHEWGDEKDCFTKEDLTTLKHTMKDTESRSRASAAGKKSDEAEGLPRTAAWGKQPVLTSIQSNTNHAASSSTSQRQQRRNASTTRQSRTVSGATTAATDSRSSRKVSAATAAVPKAPSVDSSSRPSTPAAGKLPPKPSTTMDVKTPRAKEIQASAPPQSPASSVAVESDVGSTSLEPVPKSPVAPTKKAEAVLPPPPGIPAPGLPPPPPGLPVPRAHTGEPLTQPSYQMSTAAQALLDDVKARREAIVPVAVVSPFPDFDRTLQTLSGGDGGFSFNLDPKLAGDEHDQDGPLDFDAPMMPFRGSFTDAFPGLRPTGQTPLAAFMIPPGLPYPGVPNRPLYDQNRVMTPVDRASTGSPNYTGSFNPFAETSEDPTKLSRFSPFDDERKVSRFGFARGRQTSPSAPGSPYINSTPSLAEMPGHSSYGNGVERPSSQPQWAAQPQLNRQHSQASFGYGGSPSPGPPQQNQTQTLPRYTPSENPVSEAQLRDLLQSSNRERGASASTAFLSDQLPPLKLASQPSFQDPAIMSARVGAQYGTSESTPRAPSMNSYGPPPGIGYPPGLAPNISRVPSSAEASQTYVSTSTSPSPSMALSTSDFPALNTEGPTAPSQNAEEAPSQPEQSNTPTLKAERKAAKKAAAAERAAERQRISQEKATARAAERAKAAEEKALAKERAQAEQAEQNQIKEANLQQEKAKLEQEKVARDAAVVAEREKIVTLESEVAGIAHQLEIEKAQLHRLKAAAVASSKAVASKLDPVPTAQVATPAARSAVPTVQAPLLSKKPKKNKSNNKTLRNSRDGEATEVDETVNMAVTNAPEPQKMGKTSVVSSVPKPSNTRPPPPSHSPPNNMRTSIAELVEDIDVQHPGMNLPNHCFFDPAKIIPSSRMPLEYGPLVHALSALSVGGGSFANNMPTGSIDNAVSSFQQLLETLTQTISDLLRLLPRTTWDDSSSFDGVLRDMLKGDDFLDDGGEDGAGSGKEDEVAALTLALERRARWMEVQLAKLEELHRDINTAAVRAVFSFNDNGWDKRGFMPKVGNTLARFDKIGMKEENGVLVPMSIDEMQKKLVVCEEAAAFAEAEMRESMERMQLIRPYDEDEEE